MYSKNPLNLFLLCTLDFVLLLLCLCCYNSRICRSAQKQLNLMCRNLPTFDLHKQASNFGSPSSWSGIHSAPTHVFDHILYLLIKLVFREQLFFANFNFFGFFFPFSSRLSSCVCMVFFGCFGRSRCGF